MLFKIEVPRDVLEEVDRQVNIMHNVALHNLGNSMVRNGNVERDKKVADATRVVHDIVMTVVWSIREREEREHPGDRNLVEDFCCSYVSE